MTETTTYNEAGAAVQAAVAALDHTLVKFEAAARKAKVHGSGSLQAWTRSLAGTGRGINEHAAQLRQTPDYRDRVNAAIAAL